MCVSMALIGMALQAKGAGASVVLAPSQQLSSQMASAVATDAQGDVFYTTYNGSSQQTSLNVIANSTGTLFGTSVAAGVATTISGVSIGGQVNQIAIDASGTIFFALAGQAAPEILPQSAVTIAGWSYSANSLQIMSAAVATGATPLTSFTGDAGIAVDANDNVFATVTGTGSTSAVVIFANQTVTLLGQSMTSGNQYSVAAPSATILKSLAVDASDTLYASTDSSEVVVYSGVAETTLNVHVPATTWTPLPHLSTAGSSTDLLTGTNDQIALDAAGNLYVEDSNQIVIDSVSPQSSSKFSQNLDANAIVALANLSPLSSVQSLAVDPWGDLIIGQSGGTYRFESGTDPVCIPGYVASNGRCIATPAGTYAPAGVSTSIDCAVGYYQGNPGATACVKSPPGTFVSIPGQSEVSICPVGSYQPTAGSTSCIQSAAGTYLPQLGAITSAVALPCPAGDYCPRGSGTPVLCPGGEYSTGNAIECSPSDLGYYIPDPSNSATAGATAATICPIGSYCSQSGLTAATHCPPGTYQPLQGQVDCLSTPAGSYSGSDASAVTPCPLGDYCPSNSGTPTPCPNGNYCPVSSAAPTICPAGFSCTATVATACPVNKYCTGGTAAPIWCPAGEFTSVEQSSSCIPIPAGQYETIANDNSITVQSCPEGHYCLGGASSDVQCPMGTYMQDTGQSQCTDAPVGHFVSLPGQTSTSACSSGFYQPSVGMTSCIAAHVGTYVPVGGSDHEMLCPPGTFQSHTSSTHCIDATPGTFAAGWANTQATACPAGTTTTRPAQSSCQSLPILSALSLTKTSHHGGATLTLTGANLSGATAVIFGGKTLVAHFILSANGTSIKVKIPTEKKGATVSVQVQTAAGVTTLSHALQIHFT